VATEHEVGGSEDHAHLIIDLVSDAAGQPPYRFETLERTHRFLGAALSGHVPSEGAAMNESTVVPVHARIDQHILDGAVLTPHARWVVTELLVGVEATPDVVDHLPID